MSLDLALSLLRQGRNGSQILSILESIAADAQPQEEPIQF